MDMKNNEKTQKYRMVAIDLDETLLDPESALSEYAAGVLRAIAEKDVKVVVCTGRAYVASLLYLRQINLSGAGIFCNGAQIRVFPEGNVLQEHLIPIEEAKLAIRLGEETGGHPRIYTDDLLYVSRMIEEDKVFSDRTGVTIKAVGDLCAFLDTFGKPGKSGNPPIKVINYMRNPELAPVLVEKSNRVFQDRLYVTQTMSINQAIFVEFINISANKGNAVKQLAGMWGISKEEKIAAGDHLNDLTMFAEAGFSIAPQNAQAAVLEAASAVCLSNAEDGVAKKLSEIFLS